MWWVVRVGGNGDSLSGALATTASSTSNVGTYQGTLAASSNYAWSYTGNNVTVGQRSITVAADAQSMTYGNSVPTLTYVVGGSGLVNGDSLSGALATTASSTSNVADLWHHHQAPSCVELRFELYRQQRDGWTAIDDCCR